MKLPKVRFSLKTLIALVACCAVLFSTVQLIRRYMRLRALDAAVKSTDLAAIDASVEAIRKTQRTDEAVQSLVETLTNPDNPPAVRGDAAYALGGMGPDAELAVPALLQPAVI